ncbi:GAF domain-containing protein [Microbacterium sp. RU33B]|uniref:sensor histidine kinase n=1 Tax=Microbacterium sp. RU33B TaxID=1907390 RepID=UPI000960EEC4|nr:GAF domain-containing protein [Microbacterium sp. RU33B]SIT69412.1 Histidine kinase-, DNA gyrase B-, and HSP90-like ATPase [Microbacterium sp. RU33B]
MSDSANARTEHSGADPYGSDLAPHERRLQDLLQASTSIVERLDLEEVLRRIVEAGMRLVGARYGALGVIGPDGGLERFIHVGADRHVVAQIDHPPEGLGVLGAVIADGAPIRLRHLHDDARSVGFPAHHPAMDSFLGVPVRVGADVYGTLYLTESAAGGFSSEDEDLVVALAATAGIAIENARLYDVARTREVWNATIADVMAAMLDITGDDVLDVIAERVAALIDAELVAVAVPHGEDELRLAAVHGAVVPSLNGRVYPATGTLAARALAERQAVSVSGQPTTTMFPWQPGIGPTVAIPLIAGDETHGVLTVSRAADGSPFSAADLDMAFSFAAQASIALEVVRAREDRRRLETARDRARIARDLHDHVIQRLFGAGLALQAVSAVSSPDVTETIESQIDAIDAAIKDIRTIVFALSSGERRGSERIKDRLLDVIADMTSSWEAPPRVTFEGPLDAVVDAELADDLVGALRELLANVTRHAHAHHVDVSVSMADGTARLSVRDDGRGIPEGGRRSGLHNLAERAILHDGRMSILTSPAGTSVEWTAAVPAARDAEEES